MLRGLHTPAPLLLRLLSPAVATPAPPPPPPPVAPQVRERDWSNVVTAHAGDTRAYVWRLQNYALGEWVLFPPGKQLAGAPETQVTSVCLR